MKDKHRKKNESEGGFAQAYFIVMTTIGVLYMEHRYANLSQAKMHIVMGASVMACLACIFSVLKTEKKELKIDMIDWAVMVFAITQIVSGVLSPYGRVTFWGASEWKMGWGVVVTLCLMYFILSRCFIYNHNIWLPAMFIFMIESLWFFSQYMGYDFFSLYEGMISTKIDYLGTIGNANWYVGYFVFVFFPLLHLSLQATEKTTKSIYGIFFCLAYSSAFLCHSDSIYLALAIGLIIEVYYILDNPETLSAFVMQGVYWGLAGVLVSMMPEKYMKRMDGISGYLIKNKMYIYVLIVSMILWIVLRKSKIKKVPLIGKRIYICGFMVLLAVGIGYFLTHFSESWGTNRGKIWILGFTNFKKFNVIEKFVGTGPDTVVLLLGNTSIKGKYISGVHNEFLQNLICTGILGCISYCLIYVSVIIKMVRMDKKSEICRAFFIAIMAYGAQALVNNAQVLNFALFFVMLVVFKSQIMREEK